jgi:hypothetical protein
MRVVVRALGGVAVATILVGLASVPVFAAPKDHCWLGATLRSPRLERRGRRSWRARGRVRRAVSYVSAARSVSVRGSCWTVPQAEAVVGFTGVPALG